MDSRRLGHGLWGLPEEPPARCLSSPITLPEAPGLTFPSLGAAARYQAALARCQHLRVELAAAEEHLRHLAHQAHWSLGAIWEQEG